MCLPPNGGDDDIHGDVAHAHRKGDATHVRHDIAAALKDQLSRIRIKEVHIEVHNGTVIYRHDEGETLLDQDAVAIHIEPIKEVPRHGDTIVPKQIIEELSGERGGVRFLLAHEHTAATRMASIVMVSVARAPCHGSSEHEDANDALIGIRDLLKRVAQ